MRTMLVLSVVLVSLLGSAFVRAGGSTVTSAAVLTTAGVSPEVGTPDPKAVSTAEKDAVRAVDEFWRRDFPVLFGKPYTGPHVSGGYVGNSGPTCAGKRSVPNNAFYCQGQDFLAWDQNLMSVGYQRIGSSWVYLIIAHEWGHAIQARINRRLVSVAAELQADCLAGATLAGAQRDGLITMRPGDSRQLGRTLTALADNYPWTSQQDHGNAAQRATSFNLGAQHGVPACLAR